MTRAWTGSIPRVLVLMTLLAATIAALLLSNAGAAEQESDPSASALEWLRNQQLEDGGFPGFGGEADASASADAALAFAAARVDPSTVVVDDSPSVVDFLHAQTDSLAGRIGVAAKVALALSSADADAEQVLNLLSDGYDPQSGQYGASLFEHTLAVLALSAENVLIEPAALDRIIDAQAPNGGWGFNGDADDATADSNTTALAIQALVAAGVESDAIDAGVAYLLSAQAADGSFAFDLSEDPLTGDANSTALAIQALLAAGMTDDDEPVVAGLAALTTFQNPSGAFHWRSDFGTDDNFLATVQAVPALELDPLPIDPVAMEVPPSISLDDALAPAEPLAGCEFHEATSHNVCAPFDAYWRENGGLEIFGYPISEPFEQDGATVQYFERARMEWRPGAWPENNDILLGRLGAELVDILSGQ